MTMHDGYQWLGAALEDWEAQRAHGTAAQASDAHHPAPPRHADPAPPTIDPTVKHTHTVPSHPSPALLTPDISTVLNLLDISSRLVALRDTSRLLPSLMEHVVQALPGITGGLVWLLERRTGKLHMVSSSGLPISDATQAALAECQLNPGETLAGVVYQSGERVVLEGRASYHTLATQASPHIRAVLQQLTDQLPTSFTVCGVPLCVDDTCIGVLELFVVAPSEKPTTHENENESQHQVAPSPTSTTNDWPASFSANQVLHTFANLIAATIKNARLYEESQHQCRRLNAFDAVVTAINAATDLQDLMHGVLEVVLGLLPVDTGAILLYDPIQARLILGAHQGLPQSYAATLAGVPVAGSACEEAIHYGQPMLRPLLEDRGEGALLAQGLESCAYLPLLAGGTVVGTLGLYGDAQLHKQIDMATLMPLSNQVGFAIANVRLYEASQIERQRLNSVISSTAEGVLLCDSQGNLILANDASRTLLDLDSIPFEQTPEEMVSFYRFRDLEGVPLPVSLLPMSRALAGEVFHDYRVLVRGASGANTVMSFSGAPAYSENSGNIEGAVVIFRDFTASQKLERAKDEFLAVAAHELRSPLASVRSYAEMLLKREQQRSESDSRDVRGLSILSQQVTHMLRMVDNLLDVSRLDAGRVGLQLQSANLVALATLVLDLKRPEAGTRELVLEADQPELVVQCDTMRIRQVLTNLVGNAIKYSPPETQVIVRMGMVEGDESKEVLVSVIDHGSGIVPEQRARLFQRFYRAGNRRSAEGLGLGLYLSREFVQLHGGRIWCEPVEGQGTMFSFTLPCSPCP